MSSSLWEYWHHSCRPQEAKLLEEKSQQSPDTEKSGRDGQPMNRKEGLSPCKGCVYLCYCMHHDVHVDQLWEIEVHLTFVKAEELVGDIFQDSRLLTVEHIRHRHGGIKKLGLKQSEEPRLLLGLLVFRRGSHLLLVLFNLHWKRTLASNTGSHSWKEYYLKGVYKWITLAIIVILHPT